MYCDNHIQCCIFYYIKIRSITVWYIIRENKILISVGACLSLETCFCLLFHTCGISDTPQFTVLIIKRNKKAFHLVWSWWELDFGTWSRHLKALLTELISSRPRFLACPSLSSGCTSCCLPPTSLYASSYVFLRSPCRSSISFVGVQSPSLVATFQKVSRSDFQ